MSFITSSTDGTLPLSSVTISSLVSVTVSSPDSSISLSSITKPVSESSTVPSLFTTTLSIVSLPP